MKGLSTRAYALFAGAKRAKVFNSLGDIFAEKAKDDSSRFAAFNFDIEKHLVCDRLAVDKSKESDEEEGCDLHGVGCCSVDIVLEPGFFKGANDREG
mmetsp:Transcript_91799/g.137480  ORF Transcript_91799/g.137480 Transcript_91799/m.137480 type:complete len:97 (+) Transcript_91799:391-681(+)